MKILAASADYLPHLGGVSLMTHHLCNALSDLGADVTVLVPTDEEQVTAWTRHYRLLEDPEAQPVCMEGQAFSQVEYPRICNRVEHFVDINSFDRLVSFHAHYYGQVFRRLAKEREIPHSQVIHGAELRHQQQWATLRRGIEKALKGRWPMLELEMLSAIHQADEILVNSPYTALSSLEWDDEKTCRSSGVGYPSRT